MNTDTMIALAADTQAQYLKTAARERRVVEAAAGRPRRSPVQDARLSIGKMLIAAGGRLQGVTATLPERGSATAPVPVAGTSH